MSKKDWRLRLDHILKATDEVADFISKHDKDSFARDRMAYLAVERNIEIIAEATKHIPDSIKTEYASIPWRDIVDTRNIISHLYDGVDEDILWDIASRHLPDLAVAVRKIKEDTGDTQ